MGCVNSIRTLPRPEIKRTDGGSSLPLRLVRASLEPHTSRRAAMADGNARRIAITSYTLPWIEDALWIEEIFEPAHPVQRHAVLLSHELLLGQAHSVLAGRRPAQGQRAAY